MIPRSEHVAEKLLESLQEVHRRYNAVGITSIFERAGSIEDFLRIDRVHSHDVVWPLRDVHDPIDHDGIGLPGAESLVLKHPLEPELRDVLRGDLIEPAVEEVPESGLVAGSIRSKISFVDDQAVGRRLLRPDPPLPSWRRNAERQGAVLLRLPV